ncbi:hypothetical protein TGDOM2_246995 [Toxoplasma gondii GAB2-2007-GAL-DOM2]|uniref:Uncharacterized protein n=2 Tax=Toxoplasma gondii TaxID=5811 RepID=V4Z1N3_TOXGV|nr:hypothetical protein TGVEG_246995 [Toxoplasma gondii VEG]KFG46824.1 hypothetical protein TGDOM2_246995 [Toxoplasma gondii GAB2-2007-GAL-DOM2]
MAAEDCGGCEFGGIIGTGDVAAEYPKLSSEVAILLQEVAGVRLSGSCEGSGTPEQSSTADSGSPESASPSRSQSMATQPLSQLLSAGDHKTLVTGEIFQATTSSDDREEETKGRHIQDTLSLGQLRKGEAHTSTSSEGGSIEERDGARQDGFVDLEDNAKVNQRGEVDTLTLRGGRREDAEGEILSLESGVVAAFSSTASACHKESSSSRFPCNLTSPKQSGLNASHEAISRQTENITVGSPDESCSHDAHCKYTTVGGRDESISGVDRVLLDLASALFEYVYSGLDSPTVPRQEQPLSCEFAESVNTIFQENETAGRLLEGKPRSSLPSKLSVPLPGSGQFASASALAGTLSSLGLGTGKRGDSMLPIRRQASDGQANGKHSEQVRFSGSAQEEYLRSLTIPIPSTSSFLEREPCVGQSSSDVVAGVAAPTSGPLVKRMSTTVYSESPTRSSAKAHLHFLPSEGGGLRHRELNEAGAQETKAAGRREATRKKFRREEQGTPSLNAAEGRTGARGEDGSRGETIEHESSPSTEAFLLRLPCNPSSCPTCLRAVEMGDSAVDTLMNKLTGLHTRLSLTMDLLMRQQRCQQQMAVWLCKLQRQRQRLGVEGTVLDNTEVRQDTQLVSPSEETTNLERGRGPLADELQRHKLLADVSKIQDQSQYGRHASDGHFQTAWCHASSKIREGRQQGTIALGTGGQQSRARSPYVSESASDGPACNSGISFAQSSGVNRDNRRGGEIQESQVVHHPEDRRQQGASLVPKQFPEDYSQAPYWLPEQGPGLRRTPVPLRFPPPKAEGCERNNQSSTSPGAASSSTSVYSRGSNVRHEQDPYPHSLMIQLIQPLPTGIKLEMKAHRPSSSTPTSISGETSEQPVPREYALRVSLTRHDTKYISFHSLRGILPAYNEAVRLRNKFAGLPFVLPALTLEELQKRKGALEQRIPLRGHGPREAFMTVQQRMTYYRQVGRRPSTFRTTGGSCKEGDSSAPDDKDGECSRPGECGNSTSGTRCSVNPWKWPATPKCTDQDPDSEMLGGSESVTRQVNNLQAFSRGPSASSDDNGVTQRSHQENPGRFAPDFSDTSRSHSETVRSLLASKASASAVRKCANVERPCPDVEQTGEVQSIPITPTLSSLEEVAAIAGGWRVTGGTRRQTTPSTDSVPRRQHTNPQSKQNDPTLVSPPLCSKVRTSDETRVETRLNSQAQVEGAAVSGRLSGKRQVAAPSEALNKQGNQDSEASSVSERCDRATREGFCEKSGRSGCCAALGSTKYTASVQSRAAVASLDAEADRRTAAAKRRLDIPSWMQTELSSYVGPISRDTVTSSVSSSDCSSRETTGSFETRSLERTPETVTSKRRDREELRDFVLELGQRGEKRRRTLDEPEKKVVADCCGGR